MSDSRERISATGEQVSAFRVHRHRLDARAPRDRLSDVVGETCGVQAQVVAMARMALWARIRDLKRDDVERALDRTRSIVKTWSLRNALHLHRSTDLPFFSGALRATRLAKERRWISRTGLKEEETTRMVVEALKGGPITRTRLVQVLSKRLDSRTASWFDGGWGVKKVGASNTWFLVKPAMVRGLVCIGPNSGSEMSFVRIEDWFRKPLRDVAEARAEESLVRAYLAAFGPADAFDLRAWSGMYMRPIKGALGRLSDELIGVEWEGRRGYLLRKDAPRLETVETEAGHVSLLPSFDPYLLGHNDRHLLVDRAHYRLVYKDQGWLAPVVLRDGRVLGTWASERSGRKLGVQVRMFAPFDAETRVRVKEEAHDLSRFLEASDVAVRFAR